MKESHTVLKQYQEIMTIFILGGTNQVLFRGLGIDYLINLI